MIAKLKVFISLRSIVIPNRRAHTRNQQHLHSLRSFKTLTGKQTQINIHSTHQTNDRLPSLHRLMKLCASPMTCAS